MADLKQNIQRLSTPLRLVAINVAVFAVVWIVGLIGRISGVNLGGIIDWLALPSDPHIFITRPWTLLTYMFTHYDIWHILFNMLTLYWLGDLFLIRFPDRRLVWLYLMGGVAGGVLFFVAAQLFPALGGTLIGASASVVAIVIATAIIMPDFEVRLFLFGDVRLKWIALVMIILFALGFSGRNAGGHVAHFGGMIMGVCFALAYFKGVDISAPFNNLYNRIVGLFNRGRQKPRRRSPKFKPRTGVSVEAMTEQQIREELDRILDKIRLSGYSSLSPDERRRLYDLSKKVK